MKHQLSTNKEWGKRARKDEDALRGLNNSDRREAIAEQLDCEPLGCTCGSTCVCGGWRDLPSTDLTPDYMRAVVRGLASR